MRVVLNRPAREARFEEMSSTTVPHVEAARIRAVHLAHPSGQLFMTSLEDGVIVRPHQTHNDARPLELESRGPEDIRELEPVEILLVDQTAACATGRDVEDVFVVEKR